MNDLSNENVIHVKNGNVEYIQFRRLLEYNNLKHCFTLIPLNFGGFNNYNQNKENITKDYQKICNELNIKYENLCRPKQTHTDVVKNIGKNDEGIYLEKFFDVDGLITNENEKALVVAFADCTPLLFYDPVKNVISNVHSGWKGTVQMIGKKAVEKMTKDYGCKPENIICCIGPTIRKCHFEVQDDVKEIFYNKFKEIIDIEKYILPKEKKNKEEVNKYYIDTVSINKEILLKAGLKEENIVDSKICTVCNNEKIHSYRAHGKESGRNITIMELN